jgi:hypothetical protein
VLSVDAPLTRWARLRILCGVKTVEIPKPRCLIAMSALVGCGAEFRRMAMGAGSVTAMRLRVRLGGGCGTDTSGEAVTGRSVHARPGGTVRNVHPSPQWGRQQVLVGTPGAGGVELGGHAGHLLGSPVRCVHPESVHLAGAWHRLGGDSAEPIPLRSTIWSPRGAVSLALRSGRTIWVVDSRCRWPAPATITISLDG